jgi:antirestriction protein ArdC
MPKTKKTKRKRPTPRRVPLVRAYSGFHLKQTIGIDTSMDSGRPTYQLIERCETLVTHMPQRLEIRHGAARASYHPMTDVIHIPHTAWFDTPDAYYATLLHALTHSTGHASRLNRASLPDRCPFGSTHDSKDELVAEMGAAFLCGVCGIENRSVDQRVLSQFFIGGDLRYDLPL